MEEKKKEGYDTLEEARAALPADGSKVICEGLFYPYVLVRKSYALACGADYWE